MTNHATTAKVAGTRVVRAVPARHVALAATKPPGDDEGQQSGCVTEPAFDIATLYWTGPGLLTTFTK